MMIEYSAIVRIQAVVRGFLMRRKMAIIEDLLRMDEDESYENFRMDYWYDTY